MAYYEFFILYEQIVKYKIPLTERNLVFERSYCPPTNALDIFDDKWTLVSIRDLIPGKRRYNEFLSSPEKIASNILADRLKKLKITDLIVRGPYQQNPVHYECLLTEKEESLRPVMIAIITGSQKYIPGTQIFFPILETIRQKELFYRAQSK